MALSKGRLLAGTEALFGRAGLAFPEDEGRGWWWSCGAALPVREGHGRPTYVEHGVADLGMAGRDVLLESGSDVYEPLDLGFGRCRLVVARGRAPASTRAPGRPAGRDQVPPDR